MILCVSLAGIVIFRGVEVGMNVEVNKTHVFHVKHILLLLFTVLLGLAVLYVTDSNLFDLPAVTLTTELLAFGGRVA